MSRMDGKKTHTHTLGKLEFVDCDVLIKTGLTLNCCISSSDFSRVLVLTININRLSGFLDFDTLKQKS